MPVLFTIRVQQAPFAAFEQHPAAAETLAERIDAQPAELTAMNGLAPHREVVTRWLRSLRLTRPFPWAVTKLDSGRPAAQP